MRLLLAISRQFRPLILYFANAEHFWQTSEFLASNHNSGRRVHLHATTASSYDCDSEFCSHESKGDDDLEVESY